jgi:hypothetical protein
MSQNKRLESELISINKKLDLEKSKEAKAIDKIAKTQKKISSAKSQATLKSASREYESAVKELNRSKAEQAKYSKQLASKSTSLTSKQKDLLKAQAKEREQHQKEMKGLQQEALKIQQEQIQGLLENEQTDNFLNKEFDVFISHASDDKEAFVELLARALEDAGIKIWYDTDQISWGKSIRQSIDQGLKNSRFCIVILSPYFLNKYWTTYELNGIFQKDSINKESILLPIWHNITRDEIQKWNLSIADTSAMNSATHTIDDIVKALLQLVESYKDELN